MGHAAFRSKAGSWCDLRPGRIFVIGEFFLLTIRAADREPRPQNFSRVGVGSGRSPHAHAQPLACVAGPYRRRLRQLKGRKTGQIFAKSSCFAQCQDTSASSGVLWGGGSRRESVRYTNLPTSVPTKWGGGLPQGGCTHARWSDYRMFLRLAAGNHREFLSVQGRFLTRFSAP